MPGLPLDVSREVALQHAAAHIAAAWRSFDRPRPDQPHLDSELARLLAAGLPEDGTPVLQALDEAARVLDESLAPARPRYFAFVGSSGLEVGVLADALAACHDVNLAVHAGAADVVERQALEWLGELVGYPASGGSVTSGGMLSNLTALAAARERAVPGSRRTGLGGVRGAIYCSEEAHYSIQRAAELLGFGADAVRGVPLDAARRARPDLVAEAIDRDVAEGVVPVAVVATAGTTLTGAVDPIAALAEAAAERGVWLHVDGAYGLPAAAVPELRHRFAGLEAADSVAVDAHKWLYLPKACSVVLVREREHLEAAFSHDEAYMLHTEEHAVNAVDRTLEYSRPFRALKLWLALRVHGAAAFREALARNVALAQRLAARVRSEPSLELLCEPQLTIVPFRHVPAGVDDLDAHNLALARALQEDGRVYVSPAAIDGVTCLRPCIVNYRTTEADVDALVEIACEVGARVAAAGRR